MNCGMNGRDRGTVTCMKCVTMGRVRMKGPSMHCCMPGCDRDSVLNVQKHIDE